MFWWKCPISNFNKICETIYEMHGKAHLWSRFYCESARQKIRTQEKFLDKVSVFVWCAYTYFFA
jgi:hypothetical protein